MTGEVISETKKEVVLKTSNGKVTLPRHLVKKIVRSETKPDKPRAPAKLTRKGRYSGAGISLRLPEGVRSTSSGSGGRVKLTLKKGDKVLFTILSTARFPWRTKEALARTLGLTALEAGPASLADEELGLEVEGWASSRTPTSSAVFLVHKHRVVEVVIKGEVSPEVHKIVKSLKVVDPGWRVGIQRRNAISAAEGRKPAPETISKSLAPLVTRGKGTQGIAIEVRQGIAAFEAGQLDFAGTLLLGELLGAKRAKRAKPKTPQQPTAPEKKTPAQMKALDRTGSKSVVLNGLLRCRVPTSWNPTETGYVHSTRALGFVSLTKLPPLKALDNRRRELNAWASSAKRNMLDGKTVSRGEHSVDRRGGYKVVVTGKEPNTKHPVYIVSIVVKLADGTDVQVTGYANELGTDPKLIDTIMRGLRWK